MPCIETGTGTFRGDKVLVSEGEEDPEMNEARDAGILSYRSQAYRFNAVGRSADIRAPSLAAGALPLCPLVVNVILLGLWKVYSARTSKKEKLSLKGILEKADRSEEETSLEMRFVDKLKVPPGPQRDSCLD
jgi:hypothetical protein